MKPELKKLLLLNLPYLLFVYLFAKCGQAYRLAAGVDASAKLLQGRVSRPCGRGHGRVEAGAA